MPVPNVDQLRKREAAIKKRLAEQGPSLEPAAKREARKRLRRVQRRRRGMIVQAARHAPKPKADAAKEGGADAAAPAAESGE